VPHVIAYKTSPLTYAIARMLVHIPDIGLPNIIAGERIVPECWQTKANAAELASCAGKFIETPESYNDTASRLAALRQVLAGKKPSEAMSAILKSMLPISED